MVERANEVKNAEKEEDFLKDPLKRAIAVIAIVLLVIMFWLAIRGRESEPVQPGVVKTEKNVFISTII